MTGWVPKSYGPGKNEWRRVNTSPKTGIGAFFETENRREPAQTQIKTKVWEQWPVGGCGGKPGKKKKKGALGEPSTSQKTIRGRGQKNGGVAGNSEKDPRLRAGKSGEGWLRGQSSFVRTGVDSDTGKAGNFRGNKTLGGEGQTYDKQRKGSFSPTKVRNKIHPAFKRRKKKENLEPPTARENTHN